METISNPDPFTDANVANALMLASPNGGTFKRGHAQTYTFDPDATRIVSPGKFGSSGVLLHWNCVEKKLTAGHQVDPRDGPFDPAKIIESVKEHIRHEIRVSGMPKRVDVVMDDKVTKSAKYAGMGFAPENAPDDVCPTRIFAPRPKSGPDYKGLDALIKRVQHEMVTKGYRTEAYVPLQNGKLLWRVEKDGSCGMFWERSNGGTHHILDAPFDIKIEASENIQKLREAIVDAQALRYAAVTKAFKSLCAVLDEL